MKIYLDILLSNLIVFSIFIITLVLWKICFDDENLLSLNPLNDTELEILRSILIVADACEEIVNYIDKSSGDDLLSSEDEKLRIDKNL